MASFDFKTEGLQVVQQLKQHVEGKIIVITGASAKGLGAGTAVSFAHGAPAHLILLGRTASKVQPVIDEISTINKSIKTAFVPIELDDLPSVRRAASTISSTVSSIDILINNAGIMAVKDYTTTAAGIETQFATNHLGHFLFTCLLIPKISKVSSRIINLTSDGYKIAPCRFEDYNFAVGTVYNMWAGYGQSKTSNILCTVALASRGFTSFAVHPGVIMDTNLGSHLGMEEFQLINETSLKNTGEPFEVGRAKNTQQGISTTLTAALDPRIGGESGSYMEDCQVVEAREYASSKDNAERLWKISEELVGEKFEF